MLERAREDRQNAGGPILFGTFLELQESADFTDLADYSGFDVRHGNRAPVLCKCSRHNGWEGICAICVICSENASFHGMGCDVVSCRTADRAARCVPDSIGTPSILFGAFPDDFPPLACSGVFGRGSAREQVLIETAA